MKQTKIAKFNTAPFLLIGLILSMAALSACSSKKPELPLATATPTVEPTSTPTTESNNTAIGRVLPDPSYVTTIVRAPIAWQKSTGQGASVAVIQNHNEALDLVTLVAPHAEVVPYTADNQLLLNGQSPEKVLGDRKIRLLVILQPDDFDPQALRQKVKTLVDANIAVFINADLTPGDNQVALVNDLEAAGAITIGQLSNMGTAMGRDISKRRINLFAPYGVSAPAGNAAQTVAGVAALLLADDPQMSVEKIKTRLIDTADPMWQASDVATGQWNFNKVKVDPNTGDYSPIGNVVYRFKRVNAGNALGLSLDQPWPVNALNAPAAWDKATGRGVKVAIIDQGFHINNPLFKGRLVDKAAFVTGKDFSGVQNFHGTSMAKIVLSIAPEASLVFLLTDERPDQDVIDGFIKAIDYAIAQKVNVITSSAGPWPNTPEVHAAIDRAIQAGITFVWFHYSGINSAVIRPGHFWYSFWDVGAFDRFFDPDKPSDLEGGLSDTAPQIAGVAALVLQNEPNLSPLEVKQRIIETATILPNGCSLADADAAVNNRLSGRKLTEQSNSSSIEGQVTVVYTLPGQSEKQTLTIHNTGTETTLPIMPKRNVILYRYITNISGDEPIDLLIASNPDQLIGLGFYTKGGIVSGDVKPSYLSLMLDQETRLYVDLSPIDTPAVQIKVNGKHAQFHWESTKGIPMQKVDTQTGKNVPVSDMLLYQYDAEGYFLPLLDIFQARY